MPNFGIYGRIILQYTLKIQDMSGLDSCGSEYGPRFRSSEHSNKPLSFIKGVKFLDQLSKIGFSRIVLLLCTIKLVTN
jgi:hypothetical protein